MKLNYVNAQQICVYVKNKYEKIELRCEKVECKCENTEHRCENVERRCENVEDRCENVEVRRLFAWVGLVFLKPRSGFLILAVGFNPRMVGG